MTVTRRHPHVFFSFFSVIFFVLPFSFFVHPAHAAQLNAYSMIGHVDDSTGQPDYFANGQDVNVRGFTSVQATCIDTTDHFLFVADSTGVKVFTLNTNETIATGTPSYLLGAPSYLLDSHGNTSQNNFYPNGLACDSQNSRLFVSTGGSNRILVMNVASTSIANDENASYVLGQSDFVSTGGGTTQNQLNNTSSLDYDSTNQRLFVSDSGNNRVLIFNVATSTIANDENASYVLGQSGFTTSSSGTTISTLHSKVGGGNIAGTTGVAYDSADKYLFVSDTFNNRVLIFNVATSTIANGENASYVIGQSSFSTRFSGTSQSSLLNPVGLAYDSVSNRLFVADQTNGGNDSRVMVFDASAASFATNGNGENATNVIGNTDYSGDGETPQNGVGFSVQVVPTSMSYDSISNLLYVPDASGVLGSNEAQRVMIFNAATSTIANGENATWMLGHFDPTGTVPEYTAWTFNDMPTPESAFNINNIALDTVNHRLFISDFNESPIDQYPSARILVYPLDSDNNISSLAASYEIGWPDFYGYQPAGVTQSSFNSHITGVAYDSAHQRLFVADYINSRVLVFDVAPGDISNGENAENVLGQPNFTSSTPATTQNGMDGPRGLVYDPAGQRLFVADTYDSRVLVFDVAPGDISNGENAENVLGQPNFTSSTPATTQNGMNYPQQNMAYDTVSSRLFVNDVGNNRVLDFNVATSSITNGENASYVFGQSNFTATTTAKTQSGLAVGGGVLPSGQLGAYGGNEFEDYGGSTYDPVWGRLFVADTGVQGGPGNFRVMIFDAATSTLATNDNGENAENVLGQASFTSNALNFYDVNSDVQNGNGAMEAGAYNPANNCYFDTEWQPDRVKELCMIHITTPSVSNATAGTPYNQSISITQQQGSSQSFGLYNGSLPTGLSINSSTGAISGTPTQAGLFSFTEEADDNFSTGPLFDRATFNMSVTPSAPTLTTVAASSIATSTAILNANISATGGASISDSGFALGTSAGLTTGTATSSVGSQSGTGTFLLNSTGLTPNTTYYFRAYATNSAGTSTGSILSFTTNVLGAPVVTASTPSVTQTTATLNGNVTSLGDGTVTDEGFNYGLTTSYGSTASSTGSFSAGAFTESITGLTCGTTYNTEAVAGGSIGTSTSANLVFSTSACPSTGGGGGGGGGIVGLVGSAGGAYQGTGYIAPRPQIDYPNGTVVYLDVPQTTSNTTTTTTTTTSPSTPPTFSRDLTLKDTGADVLALQTFLNQKGYLNANDTTGYFGPLTQAALSQFQQAQKITPAVGYFGPLTRAVVGGGSASPVTNTTSVSGVGGAKVTTPTQIAPISTATPPVSLTQDLSLYMTGDEVHLLQAFLNKDPDTRVAIVGPGSPNNETNYFGPATLRAVEKFQIKYGIVAEGDPAWGYVGPETRAVLNGL